MQWPLAPGCMLFSHLLSTGLCSWGGAEGGKGWRLSPKTVLLCKMECEKNRRPHLHQLFCLFVNQHILNQWHLHLFFHFRFIKFNSLSVTVDWFSTAHKDLKKTKHMHRLVLPADVPTLQHSSVEREKTGRSYISNSSRWSLSRIFLEDMHFKSETSVLQAPQLFCFIF